MASAYNEKEALRLLAQGDKSAFRQIYDNYAGGIFRVARKYMGSDDLAADVVQDVFFTVLQKRDFTSVNHFQFYLNVLARNICVAHIKKSKIADETNKIFALDEGDADVSAERAEFLVQIEEMERLVHEAMEKLPARRKEIFLMRMFKGLKFKVIAEHFNLHEFAVKHQFNKGMRHVSDHVKSNLSSYLIFIIASLV